LAGFLCGRQWQEKIAGLGSRVHVLKILHSRSYANRLGRIVRSAKSLEIPLKAGSIIVSTEGYPYVRHLAPAHFSSREPPPGKTVTLDKTIPLTPLSALRMEGCQTKVHT
jgi:hypothetical protein